MLLKVHGGSKLWCSDDSGIFGLFLVRYPYTNGFIYIGVQPLSLIFPHDGERR